MQPTRPSPRFPVRTLVLMILALLAFIWMWVMTHRQVRTLAPATRLQVQPVTPPPSGH